MIDWNAYRAAYDSLTFQQVADYHDQVWDLYPDQRHYSREHMDAFFAPLGSVRVVEVGGWRGEAAAQILNRYPVTGWDNYEICRGAVETPVTEDHRYRAIHPSDWPWLIPIVGYDVAVLAHVIEHIRAVQLRFLIEWLADSGVKHTYVEAPLAEIGRSWRGQSSAHVLEVGWPEVVDLFAESGYELTSRSRHDEELADILIFSR